MVGDGSSDSPNIVLEEHSVEDPGVAPALARAMFLPRDMARYAALRGPVDRWSGSLQHLIQGIQLAGAAMEESNQMARQLRKERENYEAAKVNVENVKASMTELLANHEKEKEVLRKGMADLEEKMKKLELDAAAREDKLRKETSDKVTLVTEAATVQIAEANQKMKAAEGALAELETVLIDRGAKGFTGEAIDNLLQEEWASGVDAAQAAEAERLPRTRRWDFSTGFIRGVTSVFSLGLEAARHLLQGPSVDILPDFLSPVGDYPPLSPPVVALQTAEMDNGTDPKKADASSSEPQT